MSPKWYILEKDGFPFQWKTRSAKEDSAQGPKPQFFCFLENCKIQKRPNLKNMRSGTVGRLPPIVKL